MYLLFPEAAAIMKDIVEAIAYLHERDIAHRDLKVMAYQLVLPLP